VRDALEIFPPVTSDDLRLVEVQTSEDGSAKYVWSLPDRLCVESVAFPYSGTTHVCISSQVGCAVGCSFCETGRFRNVRNLTTEQIVHQVAASRNNAAGDSSDSKSAVVQFAGMGEPLLNFTSVAAATDAMLERGLASEVTLTTVGIVPRLPDLAHTSIRRLSVSLHATDNVTRSRLIPINRKYPIEEVMASATAYKRATGKQVTVNYLLLDTINDSDDDLERLCEIVDSKLFSVKLKVWNEISDTSLRRSADERFDKFVTVLRERGFDVSICESMGSSIGGGCGQLSANHRGRP
jgi:23S rRNA (adenine2503-C2)-methyltransferase